MQFIHRKDTCLLLDAGEGTCSQIVRFYGKDADDVFRKIEGIYISHLHADHHIGAFQFDFLDLEDVQFYIFSFTIPSGLFGIIQMRKKLLEQNDLPIVLMAPIEINAWLQFYDKNIENICSEVTIVPNGVLVSMPLKLTHPNVLHVDGFQYFTD